LLLFFVTDVVKLSLFFSTYSYLRNPDKKSSQTDADQILS